jgi:hypothetical protein
VRLLPQLDPEVAPWRGLLFPVGIFAIRLQCCLHLLDGDFYVESTSVGEKMKIRVTRLGAFSPLWGKFTYIGQVFYCTSSSNLGNFYTVKSYAIIIMDKKMLSYIMGDFFHKLTLFILISCCALFCIQNTVALISIEQSFSLRLGEAVRKM